MLIGSTIMNIFDVDIVKGSRNKRNAFIATLIPNHRS